MDPEFFLIQPVDLTVKNITFFAPALRPCAARNRAFTFLRQRVDKEVVMDDVTHIMAVRRKLGIYGWTGRYHLLRLAGTEVVVVQRAVSVKQYVFGIGSPV